MFKLLAFSCLAAVMAFACTPYKEDGLMGGYSDTPLAANVYRVDVRGNGYTSADRVRKMALVRAAELTVQNGYERFVILGADAYQTQKFAGYIPGSYQSTTTGSAHIAGNNIYGSSQTSGSYTPATPMIITNERATFTIRLFRAGEPGFDQGIDAQQVLAVIGPNVGR